MARHAADNGIGLEEGRSARALALPGQSGVAPAADAPALTVRILVALEAFENVEGGGIAGLVSQGRGLVRTDAAAAEEENQCFGIDALPELRQEMGVRLAAGVADPFDLHGAGNPAHPVPFGPGPDIDQRGSGTQRLYSFRDILLLRVVKRILDVGISLQQIRVAIDHLRTRGVDDLTELTLVSDGFSVFEVTSANELFDLTRGGQGMFMISVSSVWRELEGTISTLPGERATDEAAPVVEDPADELAARRRARAV